MNAEEAIQAYVDTGFQPVHLSTLLPIDNGFCGCVVGVYYVWKEDIEVTKENYNEVGFTAHQYVNDLYGVDTHGIKDDEYWEHGDSGSLGLGFDHGFQGYEMEVNPGGIPGYPTSSMYKEGYDIGVAVREWYNQG